MDIEQYDDDFLDDDFLDDELDDDFDSLYETHSFLDDINDFFRELDKKVVVAIGVLSLAIISIPVFQNINTNDIISEENRQKDEQTEQVTEIEIPNVNSPTTTSSSSTTITTVAGKSNKEFDPVKATVLIYLPNCGMSGSGTIVSSLGYILTNEHVISGDGTNCNDDIIIFESETPEKDPEPKYYAQIVESNVGLDIAILEIISSFDNGYTPKNFYSACIGDSESVNLSDELLIWGYPDVRSLEGIMRIDVSKGFVSGFDSESGISEKAWFSMSSDISSGNSGGGGYNSVGELVAITTAVNEGNYSSRGLLRPVNLVKKYFSSIYYNEC